MSDIKTDSELLIIFADWFDVYDAKKGNTNNEAQMILRRISNKLADLEKENERLKETISAYRNGVRSVMESTKEVIKQADETIRKYKQ